MLPSLGTRKEFQAAQDPDTRRGLVTPDHAIFGHVGFVFGNIARSLFSVLDSRTPVQCTGRRADTALFSATVTG